MCLRSFWEGTSRWHVGCCIPIGFIAWRITECRLGMPVFPNLNDCDLNKHAIPLMGFAGRLRTRRAETMQETRLVNSMVQPSKSARPQNKSYPGNLTPTSHPLSRSSIQRRSWASELVESLKEEGRVRPPAKIVTATVLISKQSIFKLPAPCAQQTALVVAMFLSERGGMFCRELECLLQEITLAFGLKKTSIQERRWGNDRIDYCTTTRICLNHGLQRTMDNRTSAGLERESVGQEGRRLL
jgi:hypothetical protein